MAVKDGQKRTEVGAIPEDWELGVLRELVQEGRSIRYGIVQPGNYDPRGRFMIRGQDYSKGWVNPIELFRVSASIEQRYQNARVKTGDVIITIVGASTGTVAVVPQWLDEANITQTTARIAVNSRSACSSFCKHVLASWYGQVQVRNYIKGGAQPGLNCGDIERFKIPLPPTLAEQEAIAGALSDADAWIEALDQLIAKKRQIKQGAMQELLTGKRRLPGFSGKWDTKRLGEFLVSHPQYGINAAAVPYSDKLPAYIRITDITEYGQYAPNPIVCVLASDVTSYFLIDGDLVIARTGASVGKSYRYRLADGPLVFAGFLIRIRPNAGQLNPRFLEAYLASEKYWSWVRLMSMRSGQPGINGNEYAQLPIELPSIAEQTAIANILSDMDTEIESLESKLAKAREIKQGMMQELLTGRIRLI